MEFDFPDTYQEDIYLEKAPITIAKRINKVAGVSILPSNKPAHSNGGTFFDFSGFDGLGYAVFKNKLFEMCRDMDTYNSQILFIPLDIWIKKYGKDIMSSHHINPIKNICRLIQTETPVMKKNMKDFIIIFSMGNTWFALDVNEYKTSEWQAFESNLKSLCYSTSHRAVTGNVVPSTTKQITTKDIEDEDEEIQDKKKNDLVEDIAQAAELATTEDEVLANLDDDEAIRLINDIADDEYGKPKFSAARASRMSKVNDDFLKSQSKSGKTVKELIENPEGNKELPSTKMKVASINDEWKDMKYVNFNKDYEIDDDVRLILESFADKEYPITVRLIEVEDTSTSEDYVMTYKVAMEDVTGKQFTITFDMPKFVNNRFMHLRGNDKVISGQLFNLPCTKTDDDTVQVVSNYRKIMISRYGAMGKTYPTSDRLIKALNKYEGKDIKISLGDNSRVCSKYELPVDYIDLASIYNKIETSRYIIYFDQDEYRKRYNLEKGLIPIAYDKAQEKVRYSDPEFMMSRTLSGEIADLIIADNPRFLKLYNEQKPASKHVYSRASIMASNIPLVVVICNSIKFSELLKRAKIKYDFVEKRVKYDPDVQGCIKFSDGFLMYTIDYHSSMLLNGLMDCDTENYRFIDLDKKSTWLDFLDNFGGRILSDGLDNFYQVFMDPITQEVCRECKVPSDYIDILIYANSLLSDNKYIKHTNLASNRYRTNEIVAGHLYQVLATEYVKYYQQAKRGRKKSNFSIKRSAVIDAIFTNPVMSDLSSMSPLLEIEANNSATFKGLSGLNADRAYSLDKRTYDPSMVGKLALSTGFSTNVGINRQTTMDMDIQGKRGYIKNTPNDDKNVAKRLSATEAVTPFGSTRDKRLSPYRAIYSAKLI